MASVVEGFWRNASQVVWWIHVQIYCAFLRFTFSNDFIVDDESAVQPDAVELHSVPAVVVVCERSDEQGRSFSAIEGEVQLIDNIKSIKSKPVTHFPLYWQV